MPVRSYDNIDPKIGENVFIDDMAVVIGDVTIGDDVSIWPMVAVRGDVHSISIGKRTNIQDGSVLHVTADNEFNPGGHPLNIGEEVTVGHGAILHACTVEDRCLIGMGATVLDGAVIKTNTMVAAGALVAPNKVLESGYLYVGNPARQARPLSEKEIEWFGYSAQHYVDLKNKHIAENNK